MNAGDLIGRIIGIGILLLIIGAIGYGMIMMQVNGGFQGRGIINDKYTNTNGEHIIEIVTPGDTDTRHLKIYKIEAQIYNGVQVGQLYEYGGEHNTINWYDIPYDDGF